MVELYTGGLSLGELAAGEYVLYLLDGTARDAQGRDVWIVQTVAARLDALPVEPAAQVEAVRSAALLRFAGPGARWQPGATVREVGRHRWGTYEAEQDRG